MTEVTFNKGAFLKMLEALRTQFNLASNEITLETEEGGDRFSVEAVRADGPQVKAFGPCTAKGSPVRVSFDLKDVEAAIISAHEGADAGEVTLIVGDGLWVKDPVQ